MNGAWSYFSDDVTIALEQVNTFYLYYKFGAVRFMYFVLTKYKNLKLINS